MTTRQQKGPRLATSDGTDLQDVRRSNRVAVLRALRSTPEGLSTRAVSDRIALSWPTAKLVIADLVARGLVEETAPQDPSTRGGRPSRRFRIHRSLPLAAAVGIGLEATDIALVSPHGSVLNRVQLPREAGVARKAQVVAGTRSLLALAGRTESDLAHLTAGVIGAVLPDQTLLFNPSIPEISEPGYFDEVAADLGTHVRLVNDADLAALGEYRPLEMSGIRSLVCIHADVAMGAGLIINGGLHSGRLGNAGELGHVDAFGWAHTHQTLLDAAAAHGVTVPGLFDAAGAGMDWAVETVRSFILSSGPGVLALVLTLDPETVVISGAICRSGDVGRAAFAEVLAPLGDFAPPLTFSPLHDDSIILGAAEHAADALWHALEERAWHSMHE